jgi:hypothetical protein
MSMLISDIGLAWVLCLGGIASAQSGGCLIQADSVGAVRNGMTVAQARQALRGVTLRGSQDGDGLPLMQVIRSGLHTMDLYVDSDAPLTERSKIDMIRVYDAACATRDGVHPGMPLTEAAKRYGRLKRLMVTEIESREYADFERLPGWLLVQVGNGQAGVYPQGKRCTSNYTSSAHIASLWVSHVANRLPDDESVCDVPGQKR